MTHDAGRTSARSSWDEPLIAKSSSFFEGESPEIFKLDASKSPARTEIADAPESPSPTPTPERPTTHARDADRDGADQNTNRRAERSPSIIRLWSWEVATLVVAAILMCVMLSILSHADGRPLNEWSLPFNINSLLATLSTVYRALLVSVSAEALSQFKWIWFWSKRSPARPLGHISAFDEATRGTLGAVKLIPLVALRDLACLPPLFVIIFSFAVGPFIQQAIDLSSRTVFLPEGSPAYVPVSQTVGDLGANEVEDDGSGKVRFRARTRGFIYSALGNPESNRRSVRATCDTGYCTFAPRMQRHRGDPSHASVGFCSYCRDFTGLVSAVNGSYAELPNGMAVGDDNVMVIKTDKDLSWAGKEPDLPSEARRRFAFANVTYLMQTGGSRDSDSLSFAAGSCSLWPCLQYFGGEVLNGTLFEEPVRSEPMYPDAIEYTGKDVKKFLEAPADTLPASWDLTAVQDPCRINGSVYGYEELDTPVGRMKYLVNDTTVRLLEHSKDPNLPRDLDVPRSCVFRMARSFHDTMSSFLSEDIFNGECSSKTTKEGSPLVDCGDKWWLELFWANSTSSEQDFEKRMAEFADWITTELRTGRLGLAGADIENYHGWALANIQYTVIRWRWLLFPLAMLLAEFVALVWAIFRTWRYKEGEMVWKSNALPLIFYSNQFITSDGRFLGREKIQEIMKMNDGRLMTTDEMEQTAQEIKVKLVRGGSQNSSLLEMVPWIPSLRYRRSTPYAGDTKAFPGSAQRLGAWSH